MTGGRKTGGGSLHRYTRAINDGQWFFKDLMNEICPAGYRSKNQEFVDLSKN